MINVWKEKFLTFWCECWFFRFNVVVVIVGLLHVFFF